MSYVPRKYFRKKPQILKTRVFVLGIEYRHIGDFFARQGYACAVINYRLSQGSYDIPDELQVKHPEHTLDCGLALCWLADNESHYSYDKDRIYIVGHSAGAFMASLLTLQPHIYLPSSRPSFTIRGIIGVEGIYDLNQMLKDYPNYLQWVVAPAFDGAAEAFAQASPTVIAKASKRPEGSHSPMFLIIHSEKDELVNTAQSEAFVDAMKPTWGHTELFITNHPNGFHNTIVDVIEDGFDIIAQTILDFVRTTEQK